MSASYSTLLLPKKTEIWERLESIYLWQDKKNIKSCSGNWDWNKEGRKANWIKRPGVKKVHK